MKHRALAVVALLASAGLASGCAVLGPEAHMARELRESLSHSVDESYDVAWHFREEIVADPEGAIADMWGVVDARPAYSDPAFEVPRGTWTLLGLAQTWRGTELTFTTSAFAATGGGLFYETRGARTCFTLVVASDASRIHVEPSDCTDGDGNRLPGLVASSDVDLIPLRRLDVRPLVDADDYRPLPCQCSSGGDCDCPGG